MDNAQNNTQTPTQPQQNQTSVQQSVQPQPISQPISAPVKEAEPIAAQEAPVALEHIQPSEPEPQLSEEVTNAGVQVVNHAPPVHENIGIRPSAESTPVASAQQPFQQLMTPEEITSAKKLAPTNSSRWLAELMTKLWSHITSKKQETHS